MGLGAWEEFVVVGRVARAHGNRGEVIVNPETDFPEARFRPGSEVFVLRGDRIERLTIDTARFHRDRPVVAFQGVSSMTEAEALAGAELRINPAAITALGAGGFYRHELLGCRVETVDGVVVGAVARVEHGPGVDRLVVEGDRGEVLIPLAQDICVSIDVAARRILIAPPEGLLELNE
jgi:16S rRNA processing protein RimM